MHINETNRLEHQTTHRGQLTRPMFRLGSALVTLAAVFGATTARAGVTFYNTFASFSAANPSLVTETFAAIDPGAGIFITATSVDSTADPGLQPGFSISSSGGVLFIGGAGALGIGNTTPDIYGNLFGSTDTLSFTTSPTAVGFQVLGFPGAETETIAVFGASGLLSSTTVAANLTPVYLGLTSDQAVTSVVLTPGDSASTVGIASLSFGGLTTVPEPTTFTLLGAGLIGLAVARRKRDASAWSAVPRDRFLGKANA